MKLSLILFITTFAVFLTLNVNESEAGLGKIIFNVTRKIGGSGKPMLHFKEHANRKAGQEAARSAGKGNLPVHHTPHKPGKKPHYHPADKNGNIIKDGSHHNYLNRQG